MSNLRSAAVLAEPVWESSDTAFDRWWDDALDGPTPIAPVSKETAQWIWNAAKAEPVQQSDPTDTVNEHLKDLLPNPFAVDYQYHGHGPLDLYTEAEMFKYAERIIKECVRYFNKDYQRDFDTPWREDLSKGIKQHFGV